MQPAIYRKSKSIYINRSQNSTYSASIFREKFSLVAKSKLRLHLKLSQLAYDSEVHFDYRLNPYPVFFISHFLTRRVREELFTPSRYTRFRNSTLNCRRVEVLKNIHMWCFARFGAICTILKTWKTPMEECYF